MALGRRFPLLIKVPETTLRPKPSTARAADEPLTIMVIRVRYADAEELANKLRPIFRPGAMLVPDPPTNSLILSAPVPVSARPIVRQ